MYTILVLEKVNTPQKCDLKTEKSIPMYKNGVLCICSSITQKILKKDKFFTETVRNCIYILKLDTIMNLLVILEFSLFNSKIM